MELILTESEVQHALEDYDGVKSFGMDWFKNQEKQPDYSRLSVEDINSLYSFDFPWHLW